MFDEFNNSASANVQDVLDDLDAAIDAAISQNLFATFDAPNGMDPVADSPTDTLQFLDGNSITITGSGGGDSLTVGVTDDSIDGAQLADSISLDADLALTGGNVGIGTTSIDEALHIANAGDVRIKIENESGPGGDPAIEFAIGGVSEFTMGVDDSDADTFKISSGGTLGTSDQLTIDTSGNTDIAGDITAAGGFKNTAGTWYQTDVPDVQSDVTLNLLGSSDNSEIVVPYAGSIVGITVASNAARTGGNLTVEATINGTGTGLTALINVSDPQYRYTTQAKDTDTFSAGDLLGVTISTANPWGPTTADVVVTVIVEF